MMEPTVRCIASNAINSDAEVLAEIFLLEVNPHKQKMNLRVHFLVSLFSAHRFFRKDATNLVQAPSNSVGLFFET